MGTTDSIDLSFVIPLYRSEDCAERLIQELSSLKDLSYEVIMVNDGSPDGTREKILAAITKHGGPFTYLEHNRNYGEHNAVMTGYRHTRGRFVVNMDDDLQNPVEEAVRLYKHTAANDLDAVYSFYEEKKHHWFRNLGSKFTNRMADCLVDKPKGFYLSSFRCIRGSIARSITDYVGPYPYIDGLLFQRTQRVGRLQVRHDDRFAGESSYTLTCLIRLWLNMATSFSILPLRLAIMLGLLVSGLSFLGGIMIVVEYLLYGIETQGYASLMVAVVFLAGVQLLTLGLMGEYLGRVFLTINGKPQAVLREDTPQPVRKTAAP